MDQTADQLAQLVLAVCAEMAAGGEPEPGLELLPLSPPGEAVWRLGVSPPCRGRQSALVALAPAAPPDGAAAAALSERLARLAADTRMEAFPLFGIRDGLDEPAAAVLLPPAEMSAPALAGHMTLLMAVFGEAPSPAAAASAPDPAAANWTRKGWMKA